MSYTYDYPRPMLTSDIVLMHRSGNAVRILLVLRAHPPFRGHWALPGGFMEMHETTLETASRELKEETGITAGELRQYRVYDSLGRDPRGRTVTVVYFQVMESVLPEPQAGDDAARAAWFESGKLPDLAFDHAEIIRDILHDTRILQPG